jgi:hypothetical protein
MLKTGQFPATKIGGQIPSKRQTAFSNGGSNRQNGGRKPVANIPEETMMLLYERLSSIERCNFKPGGIDPQYDTNSKPSFSSVHLVLETAFLLRIAEAFEHHRI